MRRLDQAISGNYAFGETPRRNDPVYYGQVRMNPPRNPSACGQFAYVEPRYTFCTSDIHARPQQSHPGPSGTTRSDRDDADQILGRSEDVTVSPRPHERAAGRRARRILGRMRAGVGCTVEIGIMPRSLPTLDRRPASGRSRGWCRHGKTAPRPRHPSASSKPPCGSGYLDCGMLRRLHGLSARLRSDAPGSRLGDANHVKNQE